VNALVVLAHPCQDSFTHSVAQAAVRGLSNGGHTVDLLDLYAEGFVPSMSTEERRAYHSDDPVVDEQVQQHIDRMLAAELLVFVYPTWWSGLPAMVQGWLQRVMVPGVGFVFDDEGKVRPGLTHVRRIVGVSTYGSPWWYVKAVNDNGRRVLTRALRMSCGWTTRCTWIGLYALDTRTDDERRAFLTRVEQRMAVI
jgi:putative NADPH-quinone reductase